jgi:hypothetical protein
MLAPAHVSARFVWRGAFDAVFCALSVCVRVMCACLRVHVLAHGCCVRVFLSSRTAFVFVFVCLLSLADPLYLRGTPTAARRSDDGCGDHCAV